MIRLALLPILLVLATTPAACSNSQVAPYATSEGLFTSTWNAGQTQGEPAFQVQQIDADTLAIRQSLQTSYEAPFLYLLFGNESVVLIDTGAQGADLRSVVDEQIAIWAQLNDSAPPPLIIMHTHGHSDHTGNDGQFADRPSTIVVDTESEAITTFFGVDTWPESIGHLDLGGRILQVIPTPGHHDDHLAIYDPNTQILFTGDMIYPGRLMYQCDKAPIYEASINRISDFVSTHPVTWLLGAHVEMSAVAGRAFPQDATPRANEHLLELPAATLGDIESALTAQAGRYVVQPFSDFILVPHPANPAGKSPPNWCLD